MEPEPYGFWPRLGTPEYQEFHRYEQRLPQWKHEMQACLSHSDAVVRERAAQALASHFRARSELDGFNALLGYADASIRRGALLAFDSLQFIRFERGSADIVPALLKSLMDPDASVARQAFVLLSRVDDKKKRKQILDHVNAIPAGRRTAGVRMFLPTFGRRSGRFREGSATGSVVEGAHAFPARHRLRGKAAHGASGRSGGKSHLRDGSISLPRESGFMGR
jgi:hypothetical protein